MFILLILQTYSSCHLRSTDRLLMKFWLFNVINQGKFGCYKFGRFFPRVCCLSSLLELFSFSVRETSNSRHHWVLIKSPLQLSRYNIAVIYEGFEGPIWAPLIAIASNFFFGCRNCSRVDSTAPRSSRGSRVEFLLRNF